MSNMSSTHLGMEDQSKRLEEAVSVVNKQASFMKRCLDENKLMDALKHCSAMLSELRSSSLSPKNYYELYSAIFDHLHYMKAYLKEAHLHQVHDLADLYELVQYAGNIIPRLYLMITIGSVFMSIPGAPVREIMRDMLEMSKGVQHPTRGLFLRHYLSGMTKDFLPVGFKEGPQGNLNDSINFILENFVEMNKLWVRLQHQGHSRERAKREAERKELRTLVGTNLVRLSQLDGMNLEIYKSRILPDLLEQIINCKDLIAQEYLMEAIIQVFQDDFHLRTLTPFLASIANLHPQLSAKGIVIAFIDRLAAYASREADRDEISDKGEEEADASQSTTNTPADSITHPGIPEDGQLFDILWKQVLELIEARKEMPFDDITALLVSSANLALSCYPDKLEYYDEVLRNAHERYIALADRPEAQATTAVNNLCSLLRFPIETYRDVLTLLDLQHFKTLYLAQPYETRRTLANQLVGQLLQRRRALTKPEHVDGILSLVAVILKDQEDGGLRFHRMFGDISKKLVHENDERYVAELSQVAKMLNLIQVEKGSEAEKNIPDSEAMLALLKAAFTWVAQGDIRVKFTLPPLIHAAIKLLRQNASQSVKIEEPYETFKEIFKFLSMAITTLYNKTEAHDLTFRLFLAAALAADELECETQAYDFFVEAFTYYEECISESKAQFEAITLLIGSLYSTRFSTDENYDNLATKCVLHAGKLLKKPDQCRALALASRLFWVRSTPMATIPGTSDTHLPLLGHREQRLFRDAQRVLETLQRSLKVADGVMDPLKRAELFIESIEHAVYLLQSKCPTLKSFFINGLIDVTVEHLDHLDFENDNISNLSSPTRSKGVPELAIPLDSKIVKDRFNKVMDHLEWLKANVEDGEVKEVLEALIVRRLN